MWFFTFSRTGPAALNGRRARRQPVCPHTLGGPRPGLELLEDRTMPATIVVNTFADLAAPTDGVPTSLRRAKKG